MRSPFVTLALAYALFSVLYLGAAAVPLGDSVTLQPSPLDAAIPFLPWTVWLYLSQFLLLGFVYWQAWGSAEWGRNLRTMLLATIVSTAVFVLWPTRIPRHTVQADLATSMAFAMLYGTDPATNCVPSLHVSLAILGATSFWPDRPRLTVAVLAWAVLITASTLTTKQHYAIDVLTALIVAAAAGWLGHDSGPPRPLGRLPACDHPRPDCGPIRAPGEGQSISHLRELARPYATRTRPGWGRFRGGGRGPISHV